MANYTSAYTGAEIDTAVSKINSINKNAIEINQAFSDLDNAITNINTLTSNQKIFQASATSVTGNAGINLQCRKYGPLVSININNTATGTINAWGLVGILPEKYRPRTGWNQGFWANPLYAGQGFYIPDSSGEVHTNAQITSGQGCWCTMTFIGNDD